MKTEQEILEAAEVEFPQRPKSDFGDDTLRYIRYLRVVDRSKAAFVKGYKLAYDLGYNDGHMDGYGEGLDDGMNK